MKRPTDPFSIVLILLLGGVLVFVLTRPSGWFAFLGGSG